MELSVLKRDLNLLLAVLGSKASGTHLPCPFHNGGTNFSIYQSRDGDVWMWKCQSAGCGSGTIIDAAMKRYNCETVIDGLKAIERNLGVDILRDEEVVEPIIDAERAQRTVDLAHENLLDSALLQHLFLTKKRGITLEIVKQYKLGFAGDDNGVGWAVAGKNWRVFGWVLPITDATGRLVFVKFHFEKQPFPKGPKCMAAPFGTYPPRDVLKKIEPKHGTMTLWPPPEEFAGCERMFLCPGELKALALRSAGFAATSPTTGENKFQTRILDRIVNAKPRSVFITYDDDVPKLINGKWVRKGCDWRDEMLEALGQRGVPAYAFAYGDAHVETQPVHPVAAPKPANVVPVAAVPVRSVPRVLTPNEEWDRLEDKLVREAEARGETCTVSPDATTQDLKNLLALNKPVDSQRWETQSDILARHGIGPSAELTQEMRRFHRKPIGKCRT